MFDRFFLSLLCAASLTACVSGPPVPSPLDPAEVQSAAEQAPRVRVEASATFAAVGDLLMHGAVKKSAAAAATVNAEGVSSNFDGFGALFEGLKPAVSSADFAFANLETPIAPVHGRGSRSFVFNAPSALLPALDDTGFDIVSFANNHVYDQGVKGLTETVEQLTASPLDFVGAGTDCAAARAPRVVDINGVSVGFIATTMLFNGNLNSGEDKPCAFDFDMDEALASVASAREQGAEIVVLSIHWGAEYKTAPSRGQIAIGHQLLEGGVDLVLGHHAHVLLPIEIHQTKDNRMGVIAYGLGNSISNQSRQYIHGVHSDEFGNTRDGVVLLVDFVRKNYGAGPDGSDQIRTELANVRAVPTWTLNNANELRRGEAPHIRVLQTHHLLRDAESALLEQSDKDRTLELKKEIELYRTRLEEVDKILGEGFVHELRQPDRAASGGDEGASEGPPQAD